MFSLFEKVLPDSCIVRYEMLIGERDRRPDFALIDPARGILIVEVKDWGIERIAQTTKDQFYIQGYQGSSFPKPQLNPDLKCQIYLREAREQLVSMSVLRDEAGRLIIPIEYFVAFINISRREFIGKGLGQLIPENRALFRDDLRTDGKSFYEQYDRVLPKLQTTISEKQAKAIVEALFTDIVIKAAPADKENIVLGAESYPIDPEQEQIAKSLGEGPRLLRGIAGTGKTLIMLYRAKLLAANDPTGRIRILVLCWNVSLANYMRQLYKRLQLKASEQQVIIKHFASFAGGFLKRLIEYDEFDDPEFINKLETVLIREYDKYDAIYIDEAQDFRREWIEFLFHRLLRGDDPRTRNLLIAADDAQRIYLKRDFSWTDLATEDTSRLYQGGDFSWSKLGIPMQGRAKILKTVYRNSARVWIFAAYLLEDEAAYSNQSETQVQFSSKGGYDPELIEYPTPKAQINKAVEIIEAMVKANYAYRNVLILYRHAKFKNFHWVEQLQTRLSQKNIPYESITENKRDFEWRANTVKISTVHSAKGMDSPVVIVLGAETFVDKYEDQDETKLMYVALTRAREYLVVLHTGDDGLVPKLRYCQEQYFQYRDVIIEHLEDI